MIELSNVNYKIQVIMSIKMAVIIYLTVDTDILDGISALLYACLY